MRLVWDSLEDRTYEYGLDRGVLYPVDGPGVPWYGLISVDESNEGEKTEPLYFDGEKWADSQLFSDFTASLTAYTYPAEFERYEGTQEGQIGLMVYGQDVETFGLSYRVQCGATDDEEAGHRIHICYNLTAVAQTRKYETISNNPDALEFVWDIQGVPVKLEGFRPTAHFIFDTRYMSPDIIELLESHLYGTNFDDPQLPSMDELLDIFEEVDGIIIIDHGDGTWSARGPGNKIERVGDRFTITEANATYLSPELYSVSSSGG